MYKVTIITKYNTIHLECEDLNTPEMQEIFNQPYVLEIKAEQVKEDIKCRKLVKKDEDN